MHRSGKASLVLVLGLLAGIILIGIIVLMQGSSSPSTTANEFMTGLATGDVDKLMETSVIGDDPPEVAREKWKKTVFRGEYYRFAWRILNTFTPTDGEAVVAMDVAKNVGFPTTSQVKIQIPLTRIDGKWYVDARGLTRDFYPGLPR